MAQLLNTEFIFIPCILLAFLFLSAFHGRPGNIFNSESKRGTIISALLALFSITLISINISGHSYHSFTGNRTGDSEIYAGLLLFIVTSIYVYKDNRHTAILYFSTFLVIVYLSILRTRTGYVAVAIGLLILAVVLFYLWKNGTITDTSALKRKSMIITGIFGIAIAISAVLPSKIENRSSLYNTVTSIFDKDYHSNKLRLIYWDASLKMFADNPMTGIGAGKWTSMAPRYRGDIFNDENKSMNLFYSAHNDYLEMIAEYGIWGLLYTIFIFTGIYFLFRNTLKDIKNLPYLITAVGLSVTSFFNFTRENIWAMSLFMLCLGMGYKDLFAGKLSILISKEKQKTFIAILLSVLLFFIIGFKVVHYSFEKKYISAINLKMNGQYKEMIFELDKIPEWIYPVDMNKMPVSFYRGTGNFELGNYDEALNDFRKSREYSKYYPTIMMNEASACYAAGKFEESINILKELKMIAPNYIEPQINLLSIYTNSKMDNEAKKLIHEIDKMSFDSEYVKNYGVFVQIKNYFSKTGN